jgi:hypothetical protein
MEEFSIMVDQNDNKPVDDTGQLAPEGAAAVHSGHSNFNRRIHIETNATMGHFPLLSWRAIIAGFLVTMLVGTILLALGIGVGGLQLQGLAQGNQQGGGLGIGAAVWFLLTALIALFVGSYYAARISNFITSRVGAAQGLVIAALVFFVFFMEVAMGIGLAGQGVGGALSLLGGTTADLANNPQVQSTLNKVIGEQNLKAPPDIIAQGVIVRLAAGDTDGATNFFAYETGQSRAEAEAKLNQINVELQDTLHGAAIGAARAVSGFGWTLFAILFLGSIFSALGGALGSKQNYRHPLARDIAETSGAGATFTPAYQS